MSFFEIFHEQIIDIIINADMIKINAQFQLTESFGEILFNLTNIYMNLLKRFCLILIFFALIVICYKCINFSNHYSFKNTLSLWIFQGWACQPIKSKALKWISPEKYCTSSDKNEYFYHQFSVRSSKGMDENSGKKLISYCRENATAQLEAEMYGRMMQEIYSSACGVQDGEEIGYRTISLLKDKITNLQIYNCCYQDWNSDLCTKYKVPDKLHKWENCICVGSAKLKGGKTTLNEISETLTNEFGKGSNSCFWN